MTSSKFARILCATSIPVLFLALQLCAAQTTLQPKTLGRIRLPDKVVARGGIDVQLRGENLYALYWAQGARGGPASLKLLVASARTGHIRTSVELGSTQVNEGQSPIITLGLHVSASGDLLLCSTEVYEHPDTFKRLWVVHSGDLSVLSQLDPQQITSEQYEVAGFTNGDKTARIATDPVTDIKSITVWDLDVSDLTRVVSKRQVVPDPPGFLGSKVSTGRLLWMNTRVQGIAEYDIETGKRIRNLAGADTAAGLEPLDDRLLATGTQGVPGGSNWGAYLLLYKNGDASPTRSDITPDCHFVDVTFTKDEKYGSALCDGTVLNTVFDTYVTKKLEAITFQIDGLKILTTTPLNRHYDPASVAIDSAQDGLIEAIVDEPSTIRILLIPVKSVQAGSRPPGASQVEPKAAMVTTH